MHHFVTIGDFKLELQSRNAQSGSNSTNFRAVWPCNLTYDLEKQYGISSMLLQALRILSQPLVNSNWSHSPETANLGQNRRIFLDVWPCNLMYDLEKTIGHLFYATSSFMHHFAAIGEFKLELQSGNGQFGSKSTICFSRVNLQFDVWSWKTIGHLFYSTSIFVHHFVAIGVLKLELESGNGQFGSNSTIFRAVWPWNLTDVLEKH